METNEGPEVTLDFTIDPYHLYKEQESIAIRLLDQSDKQMLHVCLPFWFLSFATFLFSV